MVYRGGGGVQVMFRKLYVTIIYIYNIYFKGDVINIALKYKFTR